MLLHMHFYKDFTYREWILPFESKVSSALLLQSTKIHQFSIWNQALVLKAKPRCVNRLVLIMTERLTYFFLLLLRIAIIMISLIGSEFVLRCKRASHSQISHSQTKLKTFMKLSFWCPDWSCSLLRGQEKSRKKSTFSWGQIGDV